MKKKLRFKIPGALLLAGTLFTACPLIVYATDIYVTIKGGDVSAVYGVGPELVNGYGRKSNSITVTYSPVNDKGACHPPDFVGLTNEVFPGQGHICIGHASGSADWQHIHGRTGGILYGLDFGNERSITVTEAQYAQCRYVVGCPHWTFPTGNGLESGMSKWVVSYQDLPTAISMPANVDESGPGIGLTVTASGRTSVDGNNKIWGSRARIQAEAVDTQAKPDSLAPFLWKGNEYAGESYGKSANCTFSADNTRVTDFIETGKNGVLHVYARDGLNNISDKSVTVDCVDTVVPELELTMVPSGTTGKDSKGKIWGSAVKVQAKAQDLESGIHKSQPFFWQKGKEAVIFEKVENCIFSKTAHQAEFSVEFAGNTTVLIGVQDALGQTVKKTMEIDCIDNNGPVISSLVAEKAKWTEGTNTLSAEAADSGGSGLAEKAYSWDGGKTWTSQKTYSAEEEGRYQVVVRDVVGNKTTRDITIKREKKAVPESPQPPQSPSIMPSVSPTTMPTTTPSMVPSVVPSVKPTEVPSVAPSVKPTTVPSVAPSVAPKPAKPYKPAVEPTTSASGLVKPATSKVIQEQKISPVYEAPKPASQEKEVMKKDNSIIKALLAIAGLGILLALLALLYPFIIKKLSNLAILSGRREDGSYQMMGVLKIGEKEGCAVVNISDKLLQSYVTGHYRVQLSRRFCDKNAGTRIFICYEERSIAKEVQRNIEFSV